MFWLAGTPELSLSWSTNIWTKTKTELEVNQIIVYKYCLKAQNKLATNLTNIKMNVKHINKKQ